MKEHQKPQRYVYLRADNDPSGNPQRLYIGYRTAGKALNKFEEVVCVHDHGYCGEPDYVRARCPCVGTFDISKSEYHQRKRTAAKAGLLYER